MKPFIWRPPNADEPSSVLETQRCSCRLQHDDDEQGQISMNYSRGFLHLPVMTQSQQPEYEFQISLGETQWTSR
jgi:hypothetical protein